MKIPMFERDQINDPSCGVPRITFTQLVLNGSPTYKGEFPWLVAMFNSKGPELAFQCGATLISKTRVISAAHCTFYGTEPLTIRSVSIVKEHANEYKKGGGRLLLKIITFFLIR